MSTADTPALVVGDTGPLLCAGGLGQRDGLSMLGRRFSGRIIVPQAVQRELRGLQQRHGAVGRAAILAGGTRAGFIKIDSTVWTDEQRGPVRQAVVAGEQRREQRGGRAAKSGGHQGEVDAILLAQRRGAILLVNDVPALRAARAFGVPTATFADVLAAEIADGELDAEKAAQLCESLETATFDIGMRNPTAQALSGLHVPSGL